jgi:hypothetical protein
MSISVLQHLRPSLSQYPAPLIAAATKWPYLISCARGLHAEWTTKLHDQYGEVVRVAPDQLSYLR